MQSQKYSVRVKRKVNECEGKWYCTTGNSRVKRYHFWRSPTWTLQPIFIRHLSHCTEPHYVELNKRRKNELTQCESIRNSACSCIHGNATAIAVSAQDTWTFLHTPHIHRTLNLYQHLHNGQFHVYKELRHRLCPRFPNGHCYQSLNQR
jgi:hypothetical protein